MKELMKFIQKQLTDNAKTGNKKVKFVLDADFEAQAEDFFKTKAGNVYFKIGSVMGAKEGIHVTTAQERFLSFHEFMNP